MTFHDTLDFLNFGYDFAICICSYHNYLIDIACDSSLRKSRTPSRQLSLIVTVGCSDSRASLARYSVAVMVSAFTKLVGEIGIGTVRDAGGSTINEHRGRSAFWIHRLHGITAILAARIP